MTAAETTVSQTAQWAPHLPPAAARATLMTVQVQGLRVVSSHALNPFSQAHMTHLTVWVVHNTG